MPGDYNSHVVMVPATLNTASLWDVTLATTLLLCSIIGVPGNILALKYFLSKGSRDLATMLYIAITLVDIVTCLSHFPITVSLLNSRNPVLFDSIIVCAGWTLLFKFLQRISIFLVMLLSVSRSIAIAIPFMKLHRIAAISALIIYSILLVVIDIVHQDLSSFRYVSLGPFCTDSPLHGKKANYSTWVTTVKTLTTLELGLPSIITFFSFLVCAVKLAKHCPDFIQKRRNRRASVTVAVFTGLFLFCNLPFFTLMVLNILTRALNYKYPEPFFKGAFMSQYSWLIAKIVLTVMNAALNPVVYYHRITEYRVWLLNQGLSSQTPSSSMERERSENNRCNPVSEGNQLTNTTQIELVMLLPVLDKLGFTDKTQTTAEVTL
ncbi:mas-related G-protein coupled receptor member A7-like [Bolinopsis microptera]|uniref:mas-related G-protein coupled receptor member A7-like n=1 Tax=Bolinopsis microptera TaxID=2820187 RepID=UPI00307A88CE